MPNGLRLYHFANHVGSGSYDVHAPVQVVMGGIESGGITDLNGVIKYRRNWKNATVPKTVNLTDYRNADQFGNPIFPANVPPPSTASIKSSNRFPMTFPFSF